MALAFRRSMKTLGWFYWVAKAEPMYRLQQKPSVQAANSSFGGLYKVLHQHLKIRFNSNGFCSSVGDALTVRQMSTDTALRRDAQEECQGVAEETQPKQQKRKKLKGKVAVIKWLKFFRWKKKKEYERMTPEEKIMFKLKKARRKEARLVTALEKLEPKQSSDPIHDPEILTPEEHFYYLKMGHKCKNYVPIGRRGVFGGVILNMHLHWKKHQTLKVIVKTFTPDEVREIAGELARLSGGIVLDIYEGNTIIMYRGKNYAQPPTEIMTPRITLSKRKALDKSNYRDSLRSVRLFIPRLEKDLEMLRQQMIKDSESKSNTEHGRTVMMSNGQKAEADNFPNDSEPVMQHFPKGRESVAEHATEAEDLSESCGTESEHASETEFGMVSDSEALSDMFETDSDMKSDSSDELDDALYLDKIDAVPLEDKKTSVDFGEHSSKMLEDAKKTDGSADEPYLSELDEVDRMFLRASSLLKKRK